MMSDKDIEFEISPEARRITRRRFLTRLGLGATALTLGGFFTSIGAYILPKLSYEPSALFSIGRPEEYQPGDMRLLEAKQVYVFRTPHGFQAVSAICTHLGCSYRPFGPPSSEYPQVHALCPCHGSVFARDGQVLHGPAPRPLPFYFITLTPDGRLQVDKSVTMLTEELAKASGEGIGHNLYFDPEKGELVEGPYPDGSECIPCRKGV
jgi:Rieske Fe-S protein